MLLLVVLTIGFFSLRVQMLEEQVRDFPEQLRRERSAASAQVEALHKNAAISAIALKSVEFEHHLRNERNLMQQAESELKAARDRCSSLETQLQSSNNSAHALQEQLSKIDSDWHRELQAMEQQLQQLSSQADAMTEELQTQTARADEATAKLREAEDELQRCRYTMQHDADRLQVMCDGVAVCFCMRAASDLKALS